MRRPILSLSVCVAVVALLAAPLQAAHTASASLVLNQQNVAHRDTVTFSYTLPKHSKGDNCGLSSKPCAAIQLKCWQGATLVYANLLPARGNSFYLESGWYADGTPAWPDGLASSCTATLGDYADGSRHTFTVWAETTFEVAP